MKLYTLIIFSILCCVSEAQQKNVTITEATNNEDKKIPSSFVGALDELDKRYTDEQKDDFLNGEGEFQFTHRILGMQLRNEWGLWKGSPLKDYFSKRGIAHADWITAAIFEGWRERITTGKLNEKAIIAKYADVERRWRKRQTR